MVRIATPIINAVTPTTAPYTYVIKQTIKITESIGSTMNRNITMQMAKSVNNSHITLYSSL